MSNLVSDDVRRPLFTRHVTVMAAAATPGSRPRPIASRPTPTAVGKKREPVRKIIKLRQSAEFALVIEVSGVLFFTQRAALCRNTTKEGSCDRQELQNAKTSPRHSYLSGSIETIFKLLVLQQIRYDTRRDLQWNYWQAASLI